MTKLEVFVSMGAARQAAKAAQLRGGTLYHAESRHVSQDGDETYFGCANSLEEAYRYAGCEFESIRYHCDLPRDSRAYLESRKRRARVRATEQEACATPPSAVNPPV